jgi:hypothetical protein
LIKITGMSFDNNGNTQTMVNSSGATRKQASLASLFQWNCEMGLCFVRVDLFYSGRSLPSGDSAIGIGRRLQRPHIAGLRNWGVVFDPHRPYQKSAKFTLIRLPLLTSHPSICAQIGGFCAHFAPKFQTIRWPGVQLKFCPSPASSIREARIVRCSSRLNFTSRRQRSGQMPRPKSRSVSECLDCGKEF